VISINSLFTNLDNDLENTLISYYNDELISRKSHGIAPWIRVRKQLHAIHPTILVLSESGHVFKRLIEAELHRLFTE